MHRFDFSGKKGAHKFPEISSLPYQKNGYITFGSFNDMSKISSTTMDLWTKVLQVVENSKLLIYRTKHLEQDKKDWFVHEFEKRGIQKERLILSNKVYPSLYLAYANADIGLDTTPYGGLTITIEQANMGLPAITLVGEGMQSRGTGAVNRMLQLEELNAYTEDEYVEKALELANNINRLTALHNGLRERLTDSPLFADRCGFAREVEDGYQRVWLGHLKSNK
jgi:predicted O-linked N-acetylglucosamine transferase (SPINDLY family)